MISSLVVNGLHLALDEGLGSKEAAVAGKHLGGEQGLTLPRLYV